MSLPSTFLAPVHQPRQLQLLSKKATTPPEGLPLKAKEHLPDAPAPSTVLTTIKVGGKCSLEVKERGRERVVFTQNSSKCQEIMFTLLE